MTRSSLQKLAGLSMQGHAELWLDPLGNEATTSDCTISVYDKGFDYTWSHEGKPQRGHLELNPGGAEWSDTWHQPQPMECTTVPESWSIVDVIGTYAAGEGPAWGWRISLSERPGGELVLQMTNVAPWGERARAVRMVATV